MTPILPLYCCSLLSPPSCFSLPGIAWVAHLAAVPLVCVKVVTDLVDGEHPSHEEFLRNLGAAAEALKEALPRVVRFVAGKPAAAL